MCRLRSRLSPSGRSVISARSPRSRSTVTSAVKDGDYLYGAFGRDFRTKDGHRVMIVALTVRQWRNLVAATGLDESFDAIARLIDVDLDEDGGRFTARELLGATLKLWVLLHTLEELRGHLRPARRVVGALPDVHGVGRARPTLLDDEPDVRRGRAAWHRHRSDAGIATGLLRSGASRPCPRPTARRTYRRAAGHPDARRPHDQLGS